MAAVSASTEAAGITSLPSGCRRISLAIRVYTRPPGHVAAHARPRLPGMWTSLKWLRLLLSGGGSGRPTTRCSGFHRARGCSGRPTSYSRTSGAFLTLRVADRRLAICGSLKTTESCRIHLKNVFLLRTSLLGSPEPARSLPGSWCEFPSSAEPALCGTATY